MITRKQIEDQYQVEDGVIRSPGKFEGEAVWVPYFWDLVMNGEGETSNPGCGCGEDDECGCSPVDRFHVDGTDREEFPELEGISDVWLLEDSQGFVIVKTSEAKLASYFGLEVIA